MKTLWLSFVLISTLVACKENSKTGSDSKEKPFDILSMPADWVTLKKTDSGYIVFNSCDGGNPILSLNKVKDTVGLLIHGSQEDYDYVVLGSELIEKDTILVKVRWRIWEGNQDFKFVWVDKAKQVGEWITNFKGIGEVSYVCVNSAYQKNFKTVNQPCRECWGDECDEKDSLWMKKDSAQSKTDTVAVIKDTSANNNQ